MKRSKKLYILLGVLVVVFAATVAVLNYEEKKEEIENSGQVIVAVSEEDVTGLSWSYQSNDLAFYKEEGWIYDGDDTFPVDEEKIGDLISCFEEWEASFVIENVDDFGQYGLEKPECSITLKTGEETLEILLGDFSTMDSERYVSIGDGNVYLVADDPAEKYDIALSDLIDHDKIPDIEDATSITFAGAENSKITLEDASITYSEEDLYYMKVNDTQKALDTDNVKNYLQTLESLGLSDFKTYSATEEELAEYGLNDPELTITVAYREEDEDGETPIETLVIAVGRNGDDVAKAKKNAQKEEGEEIPAYVRIGESKIIYEITSAEYDSLMAVSYNDLRHQELFWAEFDSVTQIDISLEDETYVMTAEGKEDDRVFTFDEEKIQIEDIKTAVEDIKAQSFTDEKEKGKEEISLTIHLENDNISEVKLAFYRHDGSTCLAVVNGEPIAYVDRAEVVNLIETVNAVVLK